MNKARLLELADFVEGLKTKEEAFEGSVRRLTGKGDSMYDFGGEREPEVFRMDDWVAELSDNNPDPVVPFCKTAVCLGGSAAWLFCISKKTARAYSDVRGSAEAALGLTSVEASELFLPIHTIPRSFWWYLTPADGAHVLRLVAGGKRIVEAWGEVWSDRQ